jgi:type IX secretion system PorP/SprF family membrane protein
MKKLWGSIGLLLITLSMQAQLEPLSNQYLLNTLAINPAYAGNRNAMSVTLLHRNQWVGFDGAPKTVSLALHAAMRGDRVGLGLVAVSDHHGISSSSIVNGNFAYRLQTRKGILSLGIAGGFSFLKNDWNSLVAVDPDDGVIRPYTQGYFLPDFSVGSYYHTENLFLGISMPLFLSHTFDASSDLFRVVNDYSNYNIFLQGGYVFRINNNLKLLPSTLIRLNPASARQADLNLHMILYDRIQAGISYRSNKSLVGLIMYHVNNQFTVAYSYDLGVGQTGRFMGSSHEIMVRYDFRYIVDVINPRYF